MNILLKPVVAHSEDNGDGEEDKKVLDVLRWIGGPRQKQHGSTKGDSLSNPDETKIAD